MPHDAAFSSGSSLFAKVPIMGLPVSKALKINRLRSSDNLYNTGITGIYKRFVKYISNHIHPFIYSSIALCF